MGLFSKIFNKKESIDNGKLMTKVVYNTRYNLIILVSYSSNYFYSIIEFLDAVSKSKVKSYISHSAKEKEYTEEELQEFDKKKVKIVENRYYLLLSGSPEDYIGIYNNIDNLSNEVLGMISNDIYNHCSSAYFKYLIDFCILDLGKFRFQNIVPNNYDKLYEFSLDKYATNGETYCKHYVDNIDTILNNIPDTFSAIDIAHIIKFYNHPESCKDIQVLFNAAYLIDTIYNDNTNKTVMRYLNIIANATKDFIFKKIVAEPSIETLSIVNSPVFLRENLEYEFTGNMAVEDMDTIFQQEYDRFTQPTADHMFDYEDIDERIGDNDETENMRKGDIIDNDSDSTDDM